MDINNQHHNDEETLLEIFGAENLEEAEEVYRQVALECAKIFVQVVCAAALAFGGPLYNKIPYHTSALLGLNWVLELIMDTLSRYEMNWGSTNTYLPFCLTSSESCALGHHGISCLKSN